MNEQQEFQTIEGDWDRFYLEFPDVYDRFAGHGRGAIDTIEEMFGLRDKVVLDIGSGTGRSTFELAERARFVIGLDPWPSMWKYAVDKAEAMGVENVAFVEGAAETMPFQGKSIDLAVSVYGVPLVLDDQTEMEELAEAFVTEASRVVRAGGHIATVGTAPGWCPEGLSPATYPEGSGPERIDNLLTERFNFGHIDLHDTHDYGSVREAVETYGFIYGRQAIDYLLRHSKSVINWKLRIHYKAV